MLKFLSMDKNNKDVGAMSLTIVLRTFMLWTENKHKSTQIFPTPINTVMIRLSGHVCSRSIFPDKQVFRITESPISPDMQIGSHTFCPD